MDDKDDRTAYNDKALPPKGINRTAMLETPSAHTEWQRSTTLPTPRSEGAFETLLAACDFGCDPGSVEITFLSLDLIIIHHADPLALSFRVGLSSSIEAEVVLDLCEGRGRSRIGPNTGMHYDRIGPREHEIVIGGLSFPFAHGASRCRMPEKIGAYGIRREIVCGRVRSLQHAVTLSGFSYHHIFVTC